MPTSEANALARGIRSAARAANFFSRRVVSCMLREMSGARRVMANRAGGGDFGFHVGEHASHVGMLDDGTRSLRSRTSSLSSLSGVGESLLIGSLGDCQALHSDLQTREIHH